MAGWFEGILINESIQHNFYNMAGFRLLLGYVNSLSLLFYCAMLHNQHLKGFGENDEVFRFG
jgi:hypothetical protein